MIVYKLFKKTFTKKHIRRKDISPVKKLIMLDAQRAQIKKILSKSPITRFEKIKQGQDPNFSKKERRKRLSSAATNEEKFWGPFYGEEHVDEKGTVSSSDENIYENLLETDTDENEVYDLSFLYNLCKTKKR